PVERLVEFCRELPYLLHIQFPPWQKNVDIWIMLSISMSYIFCHVQRNKVYGWLERKGIQEFKIDSFPLS
ncbi:MAG: hypothetical protein U1D70_15475, partial [Methylobacter sp.]|nr:hypothetical protein [Methylobacter sp.]MDP2427488.1 hypothetical protein [Methylobacter sp.]MDP3054973.1 hypothetical protein [Methylobacter sp.]MDZ4220405.1 hypothetical protein [Methylobacter sp.]